MWVGHRRAVLEGFDVRAVHTLVTAFILGHEIGLSRTHHDIVTGNKILYVLFNIVIMYQWQ